MSIRPPSRRNDRPSLLARGGYYPPRRFKVVLHKAADKAVTDLLQQISRSEDDVSRALAEVFVRAVEANLQELNRARARKERGQAPAN